MKKIIYRSEDRGKANYGWLDTKYSFSFANYYNPKMMNFGMLRVLNDDTVIPAMELEEVCERFVWTDFIS